MYTLTLKSKVADANGSRRAELKNGLVLCGLTANNYAVTFARSKKISNCVIMDVHQGKDTAFSWGAGFKLQVRGVLWPDGRWRWASSIGRR